PWQSAQPTLSLPCALVRWIATTSAARPVDCAWHLTQLSSAPTETLFDGAKAAPASRQKRRAGFRARRGLVFTPFILFTLFPSSFSGEDRFPFLTEGRDAFFEIRGAKTNALVDRLEFERGGEVGLQAIAQSGFDLRERDRRRVRQPLGQSVDRRVEFSRRHDMIDHPHLERLLRRNRIAQRHQLKRLVIPDQTRQEVSPASIRHQSDLDKSLAEEGLVRRDDDVSGERVITPDAGGVAVNARDDRLRQTAHRHNARIDALAYVSGYVQVGDARVH